MLFFFKDCVALVLSNSLFHFTASQRVQLEVFKDQNTQLLQEYAALSKQLGEAQEEASSMEHQLNRYLGERDALEGITLEECELLEKRLKDAIDKVEAKKVSSLPLILIIYMVYQLHITHRSIEEQIINYNDSDSFHTDLIN